jgi:putative hemolysin
MDTVFILQIILFAVLMVFSGLFSGSEVAFFSLNDVHLEQMAQGNNPRLPLIRQLISEPRRLIVTILIGNEFVNIAASNLSATMLLLFVTEENMWWANLFIMLPVLLLFGEITPKTLAMKNNKQFVTALCYPLSLFAWGIAPLRWVVRHTSEFFINLVIGREHVKQNILTEDMVRSLTKEAVTEGEFKQEETNLINNILTFGSKHVEDLMTVRSQVVMLPLTSKISEALNTFKRTNIRKIPVYGSNRDDIIGILYHQDLLLTELAPLETLEKLRDVLRTPYFVPQSKHVIDLYNTFRSRRLSMAIVLDEHGGISGLITWRNLLYTIFGDVPFESTTINKTRSHALGEGYYQLEGSETVQSFNKLTGVNLPSESKTIGGLLFHVKGELPANEDKIFVEGCEFTIKSMVGNRVDQVVCKLSPQLLSQTSAQQATADAPEDEEQTSTSSHVQMEASKPETDGESQPGP